MAGEPVQFLESCDDVSSDVLAILDDFEIVYLPSPTSGRVLSVIDRDPANDCAA